MPDRLVGGLDWGGSFGRDPIAAMLAWRTEVKGQRPNYLLVAELSIKRAIPQQVSDWLRAQRFKDEALARIWCGADQTYGVAWLQETQLPALIVQDHGPGSVDAGFTLIASLVREGRIGILEGRCPQFQQEFRAFRTAPRGRGYQGDDHLLDALRYLLISEEQVQEIDQTEIKPIQQATIGYNQAGEIIDNPLATHAQEMSRMQQDAFDPTWAENPEFVEDDDLEQARLFMELLGQEIPEFLKQKERG